MSPINPLTKEAKKKAMLNYLKEQGTVFSDFIRSSEQKKSPRVKGQ